MKRWFLKIMDCKDGKDMYVSTYFALIEEQKQALDFVTEEDANDYARQMMPDDDVVAVEEEIKYQWHSISTTMQYTGNMDINAVFPILFYFYAIFFTCLYKL